MIHSPIDPGGNRDIQAPLAPDSWRGAELGRRIELTIAYMRDHLNEPLPAAVLASKAAMSLSYYFALFKRVTGRTPIDFFIGLRMERARHLLESTPLSVKQVAGALGYNDPLYFSRLFKSVNGAAPTDYRAARREVPRPDLASAAYCGGQMRNSPPQCSRASR